MIPVNDSAGVRTTSNVAAPPPPPPVDQGAKLVQQATPVASARPDTKTLAGWVNDARTASPQSANSAQVAIERHLTPVEVGHFRRELDNGAKTASNGGGFPAQSATALAHSPAVAGSRILRDNPILQIEWHSSISPVTNKGGFTKPLQENLTQSGIRHSGIPTHPIPQGAVANNSPSMRTHNGNAARDAIAADFRARGFEVSIEQPRTSASGNRVVDVVAEKAGPNRENNIRVEAESKLGRASNDSKTRVQVAKDAERLADNVNVRNFGVAAKGVGKVLRPVGVVVDAIQVGSAFRADGNKIGENTVRAGANLAGGAAGAWGGAQLGAAIGSFGGPVGTVVGGVVGAAVGGIIGSGIADKAVDFVKGWF